MSQEPTRADVRECLGMYNLLRCAGVPNEAITFRIGSFPNSPDKSPTDLYLCCVVIHGGSRWQSGIVKVSEDELEELHTALMTAMEWWNTCDPEDAKRLFNNTQARQQAAEIFGSLVLAGIPIKSASPWPVKDASCVN